MYKLGIDVGGTNIDFAVVDDKDRLLYGHKELAQGELHVCIASGLRELIRKQAFDPARTRAIHLGTTLAVNSLLEMKALYKVGLLRLASHAPDFPPAYFWPSAQRDFILAGYRTISGGREYDNQATRPLEGDELLTAAKELLALGAESLALISVFSPLYAEDELEAAKLLRKEFGEELPLSLSSQLGSLGFIERENTTLLNATLKKVLREGFRFLSETLKDFGFQGECFITQNNGTLLTLAEALEFPVKTIASGPTNSLIGASKLAGSMDAVVVDIGGTSTDLGIIENGFPLYSLKGGQVAGIPCNLLAPDITALAMGGGSLIRRQDEAYTIGPDSLGAELFEKCQSKGGDSLTLYDVGQVLNNEKASSLSRTEAKTVMDYYLELIKAELNSLLPEPNAKPIILVGGGSGNLPDQLLDANFIRPPHYQIANAYGAALSEVAGQVDCIVQLGEDREDSLLALEEKAKALAIKKGAKPVSLRIIEKKVLPLYYLKEALFRVLITAAGRL